MSKNQHFSKYPMAYHITFSCYGKVMHGREKYSRYRTGVAHSEYQAGNKPGIASHEESLMTQPAYKMDESRRKIVLKAIIEVCEYRKWRLFAVHVRSNHVHVVVQAATDPSNILRDFKAYSSRHLNLAGFENNHRKRWAQHGSTMYKWTFEEVKNVVDYVLHKQGEPMEFYNGT
jgi:REP element-mobilizing transposase RayT